MEFVIIDFETTGLSNEDKIIEIGYAHVKGNEVVRTGGKIINPGIKWLNPRITAITGITTDMVKKADKIEDVFPKFHRFLKNKLIVAHNASFDMRFLNNQLEEMGEEKINNYLCTKKLFKEYKKLKGIGTKGNKLEDLTRHFNLNNERAHRAESDAYVTAKAFIKMIEHMDYTLYIK
ncbi:MAG: 3'-5' exonuclease [Anaeromicrobium sp.]|jgi:DNA polymerase-3 subunit epsilon|uniref:3'-5' exonuclease n=1 Tax=Anaeromicrobium sp. TaxID=1929132 RepID=UPI0025DAC430|nr:3'-5' exonuclease [Anaeromicrobium sp.]MCT4595967.1 3'-5' exonuclease [Anaeromicrobium sp.]